MAKEINILLVACCFLIFFNIAFASALEFANFTNQTYGLERTLQNAEATNLINFTIGATGGNVTRVVFTLTGATVGNEDKFIDGSNGTDALGGFVNTTSYPSGQTYGMSSVLTLTFINPVTALVSNGTSRSFWFNINSRSMVAAGFNVQVNASGPDGSNVTSILFPATFRFSGYVKNETGGYQSATNVSIWRFQEGANGPPIETLISQTQTNSRGAFSLTGLSAAGGTNYKLKMVYYNESDSSQALKVGTILPQFPAEMYYPQQFSEGDAPRFEFMRPPSLNGTTFYLGPAATLNISANNGSDVQRFGYMIMEQGTGFPVESNSNTNVTNAKIIVPVGRTYTLMAMRANQAFASSADCNGQFMNDTACPTPPKANSTLNPTVGGQVINVNIDLRINRVQMYGCIDAAGNLTAITNITGILPRMTPWTGFVPPARPDTQDINLANVLQLNYSDARCLGKIARYNISLLNANYLVEFYGRNGTNGNNGEYAGAFQNVSFSSLSAGDNSYINITLGRLAGSFKAATFAETQQGTGVNLTKFVVRVQNATGGAITQDRPHVELFVRNSVFGEMTYIIENMDNGTFYLALPLNSSAKAKVFSNNAPPKEKAVNLSSGELNITLVSMTGGDAGFRRINSSGQMEQMNITKSDFGMNMNFFRAGGECDVVSPGSGCSLTSMGATSFNPFAAMVAGKVNMQMKMSSSNVAITFYNFDMFAAKQPPMESVMDNQAISGSGSAVQTWQFGSFVPADVYDYAIVSMPYSDSIINDSAKINMSIPALYDENWNVVWNLTRGDTGNNLTTDIDDYLGNANNRSFNSTGYRSFLQTGGVECNTTNSSLTGSNPGTYCYIDTSANLIYMRVPHFSGVSPYIAGSAPVSSPGSSSSSSSGGSSGGGTSTNDSESYWTSTYSYTEKEFSEYGSVSQSLGVKGRIKIKIGGTEHSAGLIRVDSSSVTVNVSSTPQQAVLSIGESKKFEVSNDNYYDLLVTLNSISGSRANISISYIHEEIPVSVLTSAPSTTTNSGTNLPSTKTKALDNSDEVMDITPFVIGLIVIIALVIIYFVIKALYPKSLNSKVKVIG